MLDALLAAGRAGHGSAPADGMSVLSVAGLESEAKLPFAALRS